MKKPRLGLLLRCSRLNQVNPILVDKKPALQFVYIFILGRNICVTGLEFYLYYCSGCVQI